MKIVAGLVVVIAVVVGIVGPQAFFVVDETQMAIVTRFGDPRTSITTPGLNFKTPFVDKVTYFDKRLLIFDAPADSLLTKDKKRLIVDVYARGRIVDPLLFFTTLATEAQARPRAIDIISSELRREVASDDQAEIITTQREPIMRRVRDAVEPKLAAFGIEVVDVRVKRADFPDEVAGSIYARMQAERKRKADKERAEGAKRDAEVRADVDKQATIIRAVAERDANITRGCGEAAAVKIFAEALEQDPEFYTFQRSLAAYKTFLTQNTTVVLPVDRFGEIFEDIRKSVVESAGISDTPADRVSVTESETLEESASRCAEVSAVRHLSSELDVDLVDVLLVSAEREEWPDSSLGCPQEGRTYLQSPVSGYLVTLDHDGTTYPVHTNEYGSVSITCQPDQPADVETAPSG